MEHRDKAAYRNETVLRVPKLISPIANARIFLCAVAVLVLSSSCARQATVADLDKLVRADLAEIEAALLAYERAHGHLPASLSEEGTSSLNRMDWFTVGTSCRLEYWFVVLPSTNQVIAGSVGIDRIAGTKDDIVVVVGAGPKVADEKSWELTEAVRKRQACISVETPPN